MAGGRRLVRLTLAVAVWSAAAAGCGSSSGSAVHGQASTPGQGQPAGTTTATPAVTRLGCHQYCQQAGGYGGGGGPTPPPAAKILTTGTLTPLPGGIVPVTVRCLIAAPCRGAILIDFGTVCATTSQVGRSDLDVPGASTRTIGVPLAACQLALLRRQGSVHAGITADTGQISDCRKYYCVISGGVLLRSPG